MKKTLDIDIKYYIIRMEPKSYKKNGKEKFKMWGRILSFAARYGSQAVRWAWAHKWELINAGDLAYRMIRDHFSW